MVFGGPFSRHMFVYSLIHFILCSISYGTLKAAPDIDAVYIECKSLPFVVYALILVRTNYIPILCAVCYAYSKVTRYALMIDAYFITAILCVELIVSAINLTRASCYRTLKTDPDQGTAIFVNAMVVVISIDIARLVYFIISLEHTYQPKTTDADEEIELLLQEIEETPSAIEPDDDAIKRKKPTKPAPAVLSPGL